MRPTWSVIRAGTRQHQPGDTDQSPGNVLDGDVPAQRLADDESRCIGLVSEDVVEDTDRGGSGERLVGPTTVTGEVRCGQLVLVVESAELG
jgi:hypothetical protein